MENPSQEIFDGMKEIASQIWNSYDNTYGYVTEKLDYINSFNNIQDNAMVFYRMFDAQNQMKFYHEASDPIRNYINNNI
jgi:hypothetical protein